MRKFFEILFKKSKPIKNGKFNGFTCNIDDTINGFVESGYYKYQDCCGTIHFQNKPITKIEIKKIEIEAKANLDRLIDELTKSSNKRILEKILNKKD